MNKNAMRKAIALTICVVMVVVTALGMTACTSQNPPTVDLISDGETVGKGATEFQLEVMGPDGKTVKAQVLTDSKTVGEALKENHLIAGEEGDYGLYIKTINGITLDYSKDGMYWAFYVNGEYAEKSADQTEIDSNAVYLFKAEKAQ